MCCERLRGTQPEGGTLAREFPLPTNQERETGEVMGDKPFKTYPELVEKLREKGMSIPAGDEERAIALLKKHSYFSLISGYKNLFKGAGGMYLEGTTIDEVLSLYEFDDALRDIFFHGIQIVEKHIKSLLSYAFVSAYGENQTAYLSPLNYDAKPGTQDEITRQKAIKKLISSFIAVITPPSEHSYVEHQWNKYNNVPLWVAVKTITFGNTSKMYSLCRSSVQSEVAKEFPLVSSEALIGMLDMLTRVRNVCAHNERLYDFSVKRSRAIQDTPVHARLGISKSRAGLYNQGKTDLFAALICLKYLLGEDFDVVVSGVKTALDTLTSKTKLLSPNKILSCMGFPANWMEIC